jgi:hypothetical protein
VIFPVVMVQQTRSARAQLSGGQSLTRTIPEGQVHCPSTHSIGTVVLLSAAQLVAHV